MAETVRKTYKEKLRPTPAQERQLETILWRCRTLYHTVLEQRITLWKQRGVSITRYQPRQTRLDHSSLHRRRVVGFHL